MTATFRARQWMQRPIGLNFNRNWTYPAFASANRNSKPAIPFEYQSRRCKSVFLRRTMATDLNGHLCEFVPVFILRVVGVALAVRRRLHCSCILTRNGRLTIDSNRLFRPRFISCSPNEREHWSYALASDTIFVSFLLSLLLHKHAFRTWDCIMIQLAVNMRTSQWNFESVAFEL